MAIYERVYSSYSNAEDMYVCTYEYSACCTYVGERTDEYRRVDKVLRSGQNIWQIRQLGSGH